MRARAQQPERQQRPSHQGAKNSTRENLDESPTVASKFVSSSSVTALGGLTTFLLVPIFPFTNATRSSAVRPPL